MSEHSLEHSDTDSTVLGLMGTFDWITPMVGWLAGCNRGVMVDSLPQAKTVQDELTKQGIKSRIEGNIFSGYRVMWRG